MRPWRETCKRAQARFIDGHSPIGITSASPDEILLPNIFMDKAISLSEIQNSWSWKAVCSAFLLLLTNIWDEISLTCFTDSVQLTNIDYHRFFLLQQRHFFSFSLTFSVLVLFCFCFWFICGCFFFFLSLFIFFFYLVIFGRSSLFILVNVALGPVTDSISQSFSCTVELH